MDPVHSNLDWWRKYWHDTKVGGIIVNAGGIVAYYPSEFKTHYRAVGLGDRDLFGDYLRAGREEGLAILARMDINRATKDFYDEHPDWFVVHPDGTPHMANGRYFSCVNSDYYKTYIPQVLEEIIVKYAPDGFTDNSWTGVNREVICHCDNCRRKFTAEYSLDLPVRADWSDPVYSRWIRWSYSCRMENWDLFNKVTRELGGENCLWLGMVNANPMSGHGQLCDLKEVGKRSHIVMCDHQSRDSLSGFEQNSLNGSLLHGLSGWDKIIPESMANYVRGKRSFRLGSNPSKETQLWVLDGIAGGISPWFHHIGANQEDRRQFNNMPPVMQWHENNEAYLFNRTPVANVGLVWSQENTDYYGRNEAREKVSLPWHGFVRALTRGRIPFVPVHVDHIARDASQLDVLILPDIAVMSDQQCQAVKDFVEAGGSLVFTGATATLDEWGKVRDDFPLESITGIKHLHEVDGATSNASSSWAFYDAHNYMRLPEARHPLVEGFSDTDILPFGGRIHRVEAGEQLQTVTTYIPSFPIYPPEFSWMREPSTDIPLILAGEHASGGRLCYMAGDIDRCYGRTHLPDLGDLLKNAVRWAAQDSLPVEIEGPGYLDCKLYRQSGRLILHLINLSGANTYPGYVEEFLPVGPITISVKLEDFVPKRVLCRVSGLELTPDITQSHARFTIDSLVDHELLVLE
jgi:hypothetical protein